LTKPYQKLFPPTTEAYVKEFLSNPNTTPGSDQDLLNMLESG